MFLVAVIDASIAVGDVAVAVEAVHELSPSAPHS